MFKLNTEDRFSRVAAHLFCGFVASTIREVGLKRRYCAIFVSYKYRYVREKIINR